jgi:hypothetical protein
VLNSKPRQWLREALLLYIFSWSVPMSPPEHENKISDGHEEYQDKYNQKSGYGYMIFGVILIAIGGFFILFNIIDGGGKAEEAFTLFAWIIGAPALLIGALMFLAGLRKGR